MMNNKHYLLLIAHPDDESMFFIPTLFNLIKESTPGSVRILCLSNGNFDGLGKTREKELHAASAIISDKVQVSIENCIDIQDGPNECWNPKIIASILDKYIRKHCLQDVVLITFDKYGVSGHKNHIDTHFAAMEYYQMRENKEIRELWTLYSVQNVLKKYIPIVPILELIFIWVFSLFKTNSKMRNINTGTRQYMMLNPMLVWKAMKAHTSQFVWYRRLFVIFSRYSYVNDIKIHKRVHDCKTKT